MNDEEAIERMYDLIHTCDVGIEKHGDYDDLFQKDKEAIETVLNLIEKQKAEIIKANKQKHNQSSLRRLNERKMRKYRAENKELKAEIEKKDKIIDLMAEKIKQLREASLDDCFIPRSYRDIDDCLRTTCEECIKEYFENKVKESK